MSNTRIAEINLQSFSLPAVSSWYSRQRGLDPDERAVFDWLQTKRGFPLKDFLDLGVGAGRTTQSLRSLAENYVGVDFSPAMIEICRERFPDTKFCVGDARDLSIFPSAAFDVVFFSFNGIDYVDHAGRMAALTEIRRILRPDGVFLFSSHNRNAKPKSLWRGQFGWSLIHLPWILAAKMRHLTLRRYEIQTIDYEIRNDMANSHRLLTYYIDSVKQVDQLRSIGFPNTEIFDTTGRRLGKVAEDTQDSAWLHYVCCGVH